MPFRVLVVDDSNFFQHRLKEIINEHPELKVVGIAGNGLEAVEKAKSLKPDIITMDFEMPVMDGVTAIKHIMADRNVPILMFSSLTYEGAKITLDALAAGALDFISKDFAEVSRNSSGLKKKLHERLLTLARAAQRVSAPENNSKSTPVAQTGSKSLSAEPTFANRPAAFSQAHSQVHSQTHSQPQTSTPPATHAPRLAAMQQAVSASAVTSNASAVSQESYRLQIHPKVLIIGASTGGPVALADVLMKLPANFPLPIVLVQHMPENFTKAFAERLNRQCNICVREAADGDVLESGLALLAPGGKQIMLDKRNGGSVRVFADDDRVTYKPSLDITFGSAANHFGDKVLGIVLTGMGSDGCKGAQLLKNAGSVLWSQDEDSCVVYGMPMAVARAGLTDRVLNLKEIGICLAREIT
jgi:two-component system, chemotaxis family, protein-glutamate methylesterase/glutaminase